MSARLLAPARRMFELALGEMLWGRRGVFMALAAGAPIVLAFLMRLALAGGASFIVNGRPIDSQALFSTVMSALYLRFIVPALGLYYGTALIADEVEDRTITYLFIRPMSRGAIVLGKYLAYLVCVIAVVLPSMALVFIIMVPVSEMGPLAGELLRGLVTMALGVAAYGALFLWAGVTFRRPLVGGLIFVFGWEPVALVLPGYLRQVTLAHYLEADTQNVLVLLAFSVAAVLAAMRTIQQREFV